MAPVHGIIFSKDRAMQLDLALASFYRHCQDAEDLCVSVLFRASDSKHARQYRALADAYSLRSRRICLVPESSFRDDLINLLARGPRLRACRRLLTRLARSRHASWLQRAVFRVVARRAYVLFLVDDAVFVRDFRLRTALAGLRASPQALGFSLRLGENTTHCYVSNSPQCLPLFWEVSGEVRSFDWISGDGDFSYPLEVSSSVFRSADLLPLLLSAPFTTPNTLEAHLAAQSRRFAAKQPHLLCFQRSTAFCNPVNLVQSAYANRAGTDPQHSVEQLSELFDQGFRIDPTTFDSFVPDACHCERKLPLVRKARA